MTKKKLALLEVQREIIEDLRKKMLMMYFDREQLIKEYYQMATTDEVIPPTPLPPVVEPEPISDNLLKEVIIDSIDNKKSDL